MEITLLIIVAITLLIVFLIFGKTKEKHISKIVTSKELIGKTMAPECLGEPSKDLKGQDKNNGVNTPSFESEIKAHEILNDYEEKQQEALSGNDSYTTENSLTTGVTLEEFALWEKKRYSNYELSVLKDQAERILWNIEGTEFSDFLSSSTKNAAQAVSRLLDMGKTDT
ncbi:hypothetical protein OZ668_09020 [Elizabethkingia sp. HX XZB]|jgi:hypothetical protein|uniref:hypothetical protein n=1 Tax=Elizabethkingia sp. HX XZB TaxID=3003193 RepID=UPI002A24C822|nr:hypothetical protein [Elizabethkingia sp. HX XZB]MDX8568125.1 hypothetical protein [Elizabethkingia sp. HX XZB]